MMYNYIQNIESEEPIMLINRHIGYDEQEGMGIDGAVFQQELMLLDTMGKKRIQVWINSVGGMVMDGYNICNAILKSNTPVDTYCMGMAASIAGVIFQTGRKRIMADYGILMYHNPYAGDKTNSPMLESMKDSLNTIICNRCAMDAKAVQEMMDNTSFIEPDVAKALKLCDEIEVTQKLNTKYMPKTQSDSAAFHLAANKVLNKILTNQTNKMQKVLNKLSLDNDANEESILQAIESIENKASEAMEIVNKKTAEELDKMKCDLEEMENKYNAAKKEFEDCKNELDAINEAKAKVEEQMAEDKAKNLVEESVQEGKVKNELATIEAWTAKAKLDFEGTKALLDGIAVNKSAVKIKIANKETEGVEKFPSVALAMAQISNSLK